ncbi:MAG: hypothetical protein H7Y31_07535 [Chitinophagaceae bacterium]|nr:hypothetical protein [Chitinophagaceae bacterium]
MLLVEKGIVNQASESILKDFIRQSLESSLQQHFELDDRLLAAALHSTNEKLTATAAIFFANQKQLTESTRLLLNTTTSKNNSADWAMHLKKHIRFEERYLFPVMETQLSEQQLLEIEEQYTKIPTGHCVDYPIKFWDNHG